MTNPYLNGHTTAILSRAMRILSVPGSWTQNRLARDSGHSAVNPESPRAVCWCAVGAIGAAVSQLSSPTDSTEALQSRADDACLAVSLYLRTHGAESGAVSVWNDTIGRTREQVVQTFANVLQEG